MNIFKSKAPDEATGSKFRRGDIAFTLKDKEKVFILKKVADEDTRNQDLGPTYLVRGDKQFCFKLYECELAGLDEII